MIQEYLAFGIFSSAILYSLVSLIRFVVNFKKNYHSGCGINCNCQGKKNHKLSGDMIKAKNLSYKHVHLK